ncbi:MAG TPA: hypothetical protein VGG16_14565, partial [Streptosporangiaceae bacterium]
MHRVTINILVFETVGDKSAQYGVKLLKWCAINSSTDKIVAAPSDTGNLGEDFSGLACVCFHAVAAARRHHERTVRSRPVPHI